VPGIDLSEPLLELELELLSGTESALMALTDELRQTPQGPVTLTPSDARKRKGAWHFGRGPQPQTE
jgi:triphosphatase